MGKATRLNGFVILSDACSVCDVRAFGLMNDEKPFICFACFYEKQSAANIKSPSLAFDGDSESQSYAPPTR